MRELPHETFEPHNRANLAIYSRPTGPPAVPANKVLICELVVNIHPPQYRHFLVEDFTDMQTLFEVSRGGKIAQINWFLCDADSPGVQSH